MSIYLPGSGPKTLTKSGFGQTTAAQKPGATYKGYRSYIAARRAAKLAAPPPDPFGQTSPQQIQQQIAAQNARYGTPQNDAQIQTSAQGMLDPIIAAITANIGKQTTQASGQISANSQALAAALGKVDYGAPYAGAQQSQAAVDAALQQSLSGGGAALAGDLKTRLAGINDPTVAAAGDAVQATGTAAGNTQLAQGSGALGALIANAAAAKSYGQKQPGIAQLSGLQDIAGVQ